MTAGTPEQQWAYLGPEGTFTEQAAHTLQIASDGPVRLIPTAGVGQAIADLRHGDVDAACVPMENSVEGSVPLTMDELTHGEPLLIGAEAYVTVRFDLLVRPGTTMAEIARIGSHPHGHAQVRPFLTERLPAAEAVVYSSTAAAAQAVSQGQLDAAAAAPYAGEKYGLISLADDIGMISGAVTRFVLLRRPGGSVPRTGNDRTSLVVFVQNEPGTLMAVLAELANRGINMTRLESRPARSDLGQYFFLLDCDGHIEDPAMADAIAALHRRTEGLRFLGSYPRGAGTSVPPPPTSAPEAYEKAGEFVRGLLA